jgi:hypothetical protein
MSSGLLGSFAIEAGPSSQPNQRTNEVDKAEKGAVQFVAAREDAAKVLEFIEAAFDQMAFAVDPSVILPFDLGALMRRNDRLTAALVQVGDERRSGIAAICQDFLEGQLSEQRLGLGAVVALARRQDDA